MNRRKPGIVSNWDNHMPSCLDSRLFGNLTAFYHLLRRACGETDSLAGYKDPVLLKVTDQCDNGKLDLRSAVIASRSNAGSVVPFYMRPTVGGSDINSQ